jgi:hypothetical protein
LRMGRNKRFRVSFGKGSSGLASDRAVTLPP